MALHFRLCSALVNIWILDLWLLSCSSVIMDVTHNNTFMFHISLVSLLMSWNDRSFPSRILSVSVSFVTSLASATKNLDIYLGGIFHILGLNVHILNLPNKSMRLSTHQFHPQPTQSSHM